MTDKVDLSLDEIIKRNKKTSRTNKPGNNPGQNRQGKLNLQRIKNLGARSGIIGKKKGPNQQRQQQQASPRREPAMIHISNLHWKVSNNDLRDLFSEFGALKKVAVHYDQSGRSLGTAEIIFHSRDHAASALKTYNQQVLDDRPMNIKLVPLSSPKSDRRLSGVKPDNNRIAKRQPVKNNNNNTRKGPQVKGKVAGKPGPGKRQPKKPVTAEDLDADLEEWRMNTD